MRHGVCHACEWKNKLKILLQATQMYRFTNMMLIEEFKFGMRSKKHNVRSIPFVVVYKDGEPVAAEVGYKSSEELQKILDNIT